MIMLFITLVITISYSNKNSKVHVYENPLDLREEREKGVLRPINANRLYTDELKHGKRRNTRGE